MSLDLKKLEQEFDEALSKETPESLEHFLTEERNKAMSEMITIEQKIKVGKKYKFISGSIDEIVIITQSPIKNSSGFLEYGGQNNQGVYRVCFNDELFELGQN